MVGVMYMSINNSPTLNTNGGLSEFRFWCQKVLPLVYDDSLSYYETLCKIANKLNEAITSANTSQENIVLLKQAYDELLEYINDYTKTLDETIVNSVNEKINNMAESGELYNYVVSRITAADVGAMATAGGTMSGAINMGGNRIWNMANPTQNGDAVNLAMLNSIGLPSRGAVTETTQNEATEQGIYIVDGWSDYSLMFVFTPSWGKVQVLLPFHMSNFAVRMYWGGNWQVWKTYTSSN